MGHNLASAGARSHEELIFEPSLAVQFVSRGTRHHSPVELDPKTKASIDAGLEARRSIVKDYARLHSAMSDTLVRFEPGPASRGFGQTEEERIDGLRRLASAARPSAAHRQAILNLLAQLEQFPEISLLVHGFIEINEQDSGEIWFQFAHWSERTRLTPAALEAEAERFHRFATGAAEFLERLEKQGSAIHS